MSTQDVARTLAERTHRRRFIAKLGGAAVGVASGLSMLPKGIATALGASLESSGVASRIVGCCSLAYSATCSTMSCFSGTNNWWAWTCCDGAFLYACYECYTYKCSKAVPQTCSPCRSSSALVSVGAPSASASNC